MPGRQSETTRHPSIHPSRNDLNLEKLCIHDKRTMAAAHAISDRRGSAFLSDGVLKCKSATTGVFYVTQTSPVYNARCYYIGYK